MQVRIPIGDVLVTRDCQNVKEAFQFLAVVRQVLGQTTCGLCGGPAGWDYRTPKGYEYYSMRCQDPKCKGQLRFGQRQSDGALFPKGWEVDDYQDGGGSYSESSEQTERAMPF